MLLVAEGSREIIFVCFVLIKLGQLVSYFNQLCAHEGEYALV